MLSDTELNKYGSCLERFMPDLDISQIKGIEKLFGQYDWIRDWGNYDPETAKKYREIEKRDSGFNDEEVTMNVFFKDGYYIVHILSVLPLNTPVTWDHGYHYPDCLRKGTLKDAIIDYLNGCLSDGIGENPIGTVWYNNTSHEVWLDKLIEIGDEY